MSEWKTVPINKIADTYSGGTPNRSNLNFFGGEIPWISSSEVNQPYIVETNETITELGLQFSSAKWVPSNAILVAMYGATAGQVSRLLINATTNQAVLALVPYKEFDPLFIYYAVKQRKDKILFYAQGSGQPNLSKALIDRTMITLPVSQQLQHKIAAILSTVDRAIEKTEALIQKYQSIKTGLMHDLFTRGIGEDGKLRPPRSEAPELYKETEIGWIPKEWDALSLKTILNNSGGYLQTGPFGSQLHSYEYLYEGVPVIMPQDINNGKIWTETIARISEKRARDLQKHRLKNGDVIIARRGDLSRAAAIGYDELNWVCGTGCFLLRLGGSNLDPFFFSYLYRHSIVQRQVEGLAVGSTMPSLNNEIMGKLMFPDIKNVEQELITSKINSVENKINQLTMQVSKLQKQKSGLMHDLLTGKVEVTVNDTETADV